jgi:hypothetical protein
MIACLNALKMLSSIKKTTIQKSFALLIAVLAWLSILCQLYLTPLKAVDYFSYFTSLSNLLIAVSLTFSVLSPSSRLGVFFSKLSVQSAIALYIIIVCFVYNVALRGIWILTGWEYFWDNMVHVTNPVLYVAYWFFFRTTGILKWKEGFWWMIFPFMYLAYCLTRGVIIKWYPYPFLNAAKLGYAKVFFNIAATLVVFMVGGYVLIDITRSLLSKQEK